MNSMYNMVQAQKLRHGDGYCPLCLGYPKSKEHIFFLSLKVQCGWTTMTIFYEPHPQNNNLVEVHSSINIIDGSL